MIRLNVGHHCLQDKKNNELAGNEDVNNMTTFRGVSCP